LIFHIFEIILLLAEVNQQQTNCFLEQLLAEALH